MNKLTSETTHGPAARSPRSQTGAEKRRYLAHVSQYGDAPQRGDILTLTIREEVSPHIEYLTQAQAASAPLRSPAKTPAAVTQTTPGDEAK